MKTYAIAAVVSAMLAVAFTASAFSQKNESIRHGKMLMQGQRGLRLHVPGSLKQELSRDEQRLSSPATFKREETKSLSDTMCIEISDVSETWDTSANVWRVASKDTGTYDANGRLIGSVAQMWNDSAWVNADKRTYTYANGNETEELDQTWNDSAWVNDWEFTYTYDAHGRETGDTYQRWDDSAWVNEWLYTYTYDAHGNMMEYLCQTWNGSAWAVCEKESLTYDANGKVTEDLDQTWNDSAWVNDWEYTFTYDAHGNMTEYLCQTWNGSAWVNSWKGTLTWQMLITDVNEQANSIGSFALSVNYPNPFNPQTKISFSVPKESYITLKVYDLLGREVATLAQGKKEAGEYSVAWNAAAAPSGIYFYRLEATSTGDPTKNFTQVKKMLLLK